MSKDGKVQKDAGETTPLLSAAAANNISRKCSRHGREEEEVVPLQDVPFSRLVLIMCTAWIGVFLGAMDETIIDTIAGPIASEFKSLYLFSWLATAYLLSSAACLPIMGRLTDIFGRGPGLVLCNVLFAAGNLICGLARDPHVVLVGRVIAGMGGAGQRSIANVLGSDLIPLRKRDIVQGMANVFCGSGAMLGGVFGGVLNDHTALGWRLAFLIQVPLAVLLAIAAMPLVKVAPKQSISHVLTFLALSWPNIRTPPN
ncbi:Major facilitator superfamily domain, general substrate transporter [Metarhizium guizhouense ARSEF 977]|uniref:Major facilitator superfamily domain, general substrate transporter n=1 Tax=Metarhizium guizhouense (strain ARSEF 977) TaxID=1276136 RepID=A0A0B4GZR9_METGA|nr:Major facilitator superfamily domain, general substrate transporter [Metarhizium guizhouense ARSEF 977]